MSIVQLIQIGVSGFRVLTKVSARRIMRTFHSLACLVTEIVKDQKDVERQLPTKGSRERRTTQENKSGSQCAKESKGKGLSRVGKSKSKRKSVGEPGKERENRPG